MSMGIWHGSDFEKGWLSLLGWWPALSSLAYGCAPAVLVASSADAVAMRRVACAALVLVLRACHAQSCYEEAMCYYILNDAENDKIMDRVRTGCARRSHRSRDRAPVRARRSTTDPFARAI